MNKPKKKKRLGYYAGEKLATLSENQVAYLKKEAAHDAVETLFIIAVLACKDVFNDEATTPKLEKMIKRMQCLLVKNGSNEVTLSTLANVIDAETNLKYDSYSGTWTNTKTKEQII